MIPCIVLLFSSIIPNVAPVSDEKLAAGAGRFEFRHAGKIMPVWYFLPKDAKPDTQILFVMHGVNRDAQRYRDDWMPLAEKHRFIIVSPEFTRAAFPEDSDYSQGSVMANNGAPTPRDQTAFSFIEPVFDKVRLLTGNRAKTYSLYGHSAGAQFVHRFLYFEPTARVSKVVAANAGWWTLPDTSVDFPYGLKGAPGITDRSLKDILQRPLLVLLGTNDNDPNDKNLNKSKESMQQGPHRFARGNYFFKSAQRQAKLNGIKLSWQLKTVPGVGHSDSGMSAAAAEWLFGKR